LEQRKSIGILEDRIPKVLFGKGIGILDSFEIPME
jgi:hypothetical protein